MRTHTPGSVAGAVILEHVMAKAAGILEAIEVEPLKVGRMSVWIKGITPLICNSMNAKVMRDLLCPRGRKSKAEKEQSLKHDPMAEFLASMHKRDGTGPTRLTFPAPAIKGSFMNAALETKGTSKAQIGRLAWVESAQLDLYGVPEAFMSVVRSADMNRTPDVRTRAILREWCMTANIAFIKPQLNEQVIATLLSNGGFIMGIGDFRQEKGKGNYGQYVLTTADDSDVKRIIRDGGVKAQDAALKTVVCYDEATTELWEWYKTELKRRGKTQAGS